MTGGIDEIRSTREYAAIAAHYGARTAKRSGVALIDHVHEGLTILGALDAAMDRYTGTLAAARAYCLHPLVQADADLAAHAARIGEFTDDAYVIVLALEYRNIANATLSTREIATADDIPLSPLREVSAMLVADKVQNRKDFLAHHAGTHPRSAALDRYFTLWLERLGVNEHRYQALCERIDRTS